MLNNIAFTSDSVSCHHGKSHKGIAASGLLFCGLIHYQLISQEMFPGVVSYVPTVNVLQNSVSFELVAAEQA